MLATKVPGPTDADDEAAGSTDEVPTPAELIKDCPRAGSLEEAMLPALDDPI